MRRFTVLTVMTALFLLLTIGGGLVKADSHCDFADETIKFGGLAPLSAPGATGAGVIVKWALEQAASDINAECGISIDGADYQLEVIVGDSEGISERAQAETERLILDQGVRGVVGMYHSAVGLAVMRVTQEHSIPTIVAGPWNDNITASGYVEYERNPPRKDVGVDYIFRISPSTSMVAFVIVDWIIELGLDDVVIFAENTDYGQPAAADERVLLEAAGIRVEQFDVELGTEDFLPLLSRILARPEPRMPCTCWSRARHPLTLTNRWRSWVSRPATIPSASPVISRDNPSNSGIQCPMATTARLTALASHRPSSAKWRRI